MLALCNLLLYNIVMESFFPLEIHDRSGEVIQDIVAANTGLRIQNRNLFKLAYTDELTSLPNKRAFRIELEASIARVEKEEISAGLVLLDLDFFKLVNDRYGHEEGDKVLREFADVLRNSAYEEDVLAHEAYYSPHSDDDESATSHTPARLSGDEFALLLVLEPHDSGATMKPEERLDAAIARIRKLFNDYRQQRPHLKDLDFDVSIGSCFINPGVTARRAMEIADHNMYQAKRAQHLGKKALQSRPGSSLD